MLKQKAEWRKDRIAIGGGKKKEFAEKPTLLQPTGPIRRPNQPPGVRRGGRGGLGVKGRGGGLGGEKAGNGGVVRDANEEKDGSGKPKSNEDFKAMFLKGLKE